MEGNRDREKEGAEKDRERKREKKRLARTCGEREDGEVERGRMDERARRDKESER